MRPEQRDDGGVLVPPRLGYNAALDGVRALAILAVLLFHGGTRLRAGFIGVDVFFVLSGFLITSLLLQEWSDRGVIRLRGFYGRRARRLLPALFLTIAVVGVIYAAAPRLNHGFSYLTQALAAIFYAGNWVIAVSHRPSPLGLLNHIWSLAIEEQFYILWPPVLVLALRRRWSLDRVALCVVAAAAASALLRTTLWAEGHGSGIYFRTDTHADGLLLGCALGIARRTWMLKHLRSAATSLAVAVSAAAGLVILASGPMTKPSVQFTFGYPLVAICAVIVINHAVTRERSLLTRTLALPPLVWIGARSYGMYLFFLPTMAVITQQRVHLGFWPTLVAQVATIIVAAALSYRFLESRFLRKKRLPGAPPHVQRPRPDRERASAVAARDG